MRPTPAVAVPMLFDEVNDVNISLKKNGRGFGGIVLKERPAACKNSNARTGQHQAPRMKGKPASVQNAWRARYRGVQTSPVAAFCVIESFCCNVSPRLFLYKLHPILFPHACCSMHS